MEFSVSLFFPRPGWGKSKLASKLLCQVIGLRAMQTVQFPLQVSYKSHKLKAEGFYCCLAHFW